MMNGGTVKGRSGGRMKTLSVSIVRDGPRTPWGFRLIGGADLGAPIQVQRVQVGSPVDGSLKRGDLIRKIGDYDARDLAHKEAQNLFKTAGNEMNVVVQRSSTSSFQSYQSSSMSSMSQSIGPPAIGKSPVAGGVATPFTAAGSATLPRTPSAPPSSAPSLNVPGSGSGFVRSTTPGRAASPMPSSMSEALRSPVECLPHTLFPVPGSGMGQGPPPRAPSPFPFVQPPASTDPEMEVVTNQPYRTTPLVLPGAKTKKDVAPTTSSYLRHHPNPMFRAPPSHFDSEAMMKQKVAGTVIDRVAGQEINGSKIVHKQFNSPIGLYSDQNIADTITAQTGMTPKVSRVKFQDSHQQLSAPTKLSPKPPPVFDPSKSEAYKALKEEELGISEPSIPVAEVNPVQTKVFQPGSVPTQKHRPPPPAKQPAQPHRGHPQPHPVAPSARVNSLGVADEKIAQSHSFKRIMAEVLGETEF